MEIKKTGKFQIISRLARHRNRTKPGDIICITGIPGDTPTPRTEESKYLTQYKHVHSVTEIKGGLDPSIKSIMKSNGVSAEIQLEDLPLSEQMRQQYGFQPSRLYHYALHESEGNELLLTVDYKKFADLNAEYQKRFGIPLYAIGRIVEGDTTQICYIENGFGTMPGTTPWEHFC